MSYFFPVEVLFRGGLRKFFVGVAGAGFAAALVFVGLDFAGLGLVLVDGKRVNIASYSVSRGQVVTLSDKAKNMIIIQHNIDTLDRRMVGWIDAADGGKQITVRELPQREHIDVPVREQLIVELYSK